MTRAVSLLSGWAAAPTEQARTIAAVSQPFFTAAIRRFSYAARRRATRPKAPGSGFLDHQAHAAVDEEHRIAPDACRVVRTSSGGELELAGMHRADHRAVAHEAVGQRSATMRASVVERVESAFARAKDADGPTCETV